MFQANYYKKDKYHVDILLLGELPIAEITCNTLEEAVNEYIAFEEEYFKFKFSEDEKVLRHKNAEIQLKLNDLKEGDEELFKEAVEINNKLQVLYMRSGFERLRSTQMSEFIRNELLEGEEQGGDIDA